VKCKPYNKGLDLVSDCCKIASAAIFEILGSKRIGVTSLTFQGHVTSLLIGHVTIRFPISHLNQSVYRPTICNAVSEIGLFNDECDAMVDVTLNDL